MDSSDLLSSRAEGDRLRLAARGAWTAARARELDLVISDRLAAPPREGAIDIDMGSLTELDTYGARLLERLRSGLGRQGREVRVHGLPERFEGLIAAVHRATEAAGVPPPERRSWLGGLAWLGERAVLAGNDLVMLVNVLGALGLGVVRVLARPAGFRLTSTVHQLDRVCWQAVPIILLITFLIGCIIAQQGFFHFRKFGADDYVVDMVGILVLREIGVLIVSIMVAGRSGSSYTAELGSMKMREEIDALHVMGLDPVQVLLLPRVLALVIGLPILAFLGSMSALYGGGLVAWLYGGMSPDIFIARLKDAISLTHFKVGMIKAPFMALVIGIVACSEGLQVKGSAESLGLRTTASVVKAIFLVIVLDGLFAIFFASIGM